MEYLQISSGFDETEGSFVQNGDANADAEQLPGVESTPVTVAFTAHAHDPLTKPGKRALLKSRV